MEGGRLERLEEAENLVIEILELAGMSVKELKEIQANSEDKTTAFLQNCYIYYQKLANLKEIINSELASLDANPAPTARRPGVDQLAISHWEAKVIADNIHNLTITD